MTHVSQSSLDLVDLHLPICPLTAREIWNRQRERPSTPKVFKDALELLVSAGRARRISAVRPGGKVHLYFRVRA